MATTKILALVRDLLLRSRIEAVAEPSAPVTPASTLDLACTRATGRSCDHLRRLRTRISLPKRPRVRYARSLHRRGSRLRFARRFEIARLARAAGFDRTLSRSEFTAQLPELIKP